MALLFLVTLVATVLLGGGVYTSGHSSLPSSPSGVWSGPHIADLDILLPPKMTDAVQYRLLGIGSCFTWSWDHHDILYVEPEYNGTDGCSTSARLTSIASYSGRKETSVCATDVHSRTVICCEVFIDKIARIQIFHHSVKLDLGGLATLQIRAFDDNENVFSSLVGLQFNWNLMPKSFDDDTMVQHVVHVPLKETPISDCGGFCGDLETQIRLEDSGVGADLYLVKGIEIGHEIVTASLAEPEAEHLKDEIVLTVAELMSLSPPSPVFIINGALIQYRLIVIRQNAPKAIDLPSPHHRWSISNQTVAKVDLFMGIATALNLGTTNVVVEDTRVAGHKQISVIHVVIPDSMVLHILPVTATFDPLDGLQGHSSYPWYVIAGQLYVVHVKVLSPKPEQQEIYLTESNKFKLGNDNMTYFEASLLPSDIISKYSWHNSRSLRPLTEGRGTLMASLNYHIRDPELVEVLKVQQEVVTCNKVNILVRETNQPSEIIHLPWVPGLKQKLDLTAYGGCAKTPKDYNWFSSDHSIVSVSALGVIQANRAGRGVVKVCSVFDFTNYAEVIVDVSIPSSIVMVPYFPVEVVVGAHLNAAVALNTPYGGDFYQKCDAFNPHVRWDVASGRECFKVSNTSDISSFDMTMDTELFDTTNYSPCAWTCLYTSCSAHAMLHATFSSGKKFSDYFLDGEIVLQASKHVAAYPALSAKQVGDGSHFGGYWVNEQKALQTNILDAPLDNIEVLYLVPGTTMNVLIVGGPDRWDDGIEFIDNISIRGMDNKYPTEETIIRHVSRNDGRLYTVFCQNIRDFKLIFSRGNLVGSGHPQKAVEYLELTVFCSLPTSITMIANEKANTMDVIQSSVRDGHDPGNIHLSVISVVNSQTIRVAAVGIHSSGKIFANSSSICLSWELFDCEGLAHWDENADIAKSLTTWERFLSLRSASGQCIVRGTIVGFNQPNFVYISEKERLLFESEVNGLTDALKLQLVSSLAIIPSSVLLIFDRKAKVNMSVTGGTCFLEGFVNDTQVVEILPYQGRTPCSWLSLGSKGIGTALLTIYDKGLSPPAAATAMIKVSYVEWVKLFSQREIFVLEGTTKTFEIQAGTNDGFTFDPSQYVYMSIYVHFEESMFKLVNEDGSMKPGLHSIYQPNFSIKAENLGRSSIYVSVAGQSGNRIVSEQIMVELYPLLKIYPGYVFLSPGSSYMFTAEGGPTVGVIVEYNCLSDQIAIVDRYSGKLSAMSIGNTTVRVASFVNGDLVCEAYGTVQVEIPPMMFLNMQSEQLCVGCTMPIFPSYPEGNLFSFYEVCQGYNWVVENAKVLSLHSSGSLFSEEASLSSSSIDKGSYDSEDRIDYNFINVVRGRSAGISTISVSFSCDFIATGGPVSKSYNISHALMVIAEPPLALGIPITWLLPPFFTTSDILPELSQSNKLSDSHERKKRISYSLLKASERKSLSQEDAISVAGPKIKTRESNILGCLQAKEKSGKVAIACCVRVAEVAQVRVGTKKSLSNIVHLAVNDKVEIVISYCDDIGYPFFQAHGAVSLAVEMNYHDVVSFHMPSEPRGGNYSNGIAHLQARTQGKVLLKIFMRKDPRKAAYILVLVGPQLIPRKPVLRVGNLLNLTVIGDESRLTVGHWTSSNESVLSINKISGEVYARSVGYSQVTYEGSSVKLQTTVTVIKNKQIVVQAPSDTLTNVPFPSEGYKFSVWLSNSDEYKLGDIRDGSIIYDCRVDPSYIGYAKPWVDRVTGALYCLFFPYSPEHLVSFASKLKTTSVGFSKARGMGSVDLSIIASLKEAQHITGSVPALFVGGFFISHMAKLEFSPEFNSIRITIIGNTGVQINWNLKDLLMIRPIFEENYGIVGRGEFEISVLNSRRFSDKITFLLPQTGQRAELDVSYDPNRQSELLLSKTAKLAAVLVCLILLLLTVVIFVRFLDRPDTCRPFMPQGPPSQPITSDPVTPERVSSVGISRSPGTGSSTPQPFIEYVRRTIDETPYYKRDRRTRYNPQYSY